jgi:hypothetical protein
MYTTAALRKCISAVSALVIRYFVNVQYSDQYESVTNHQFSTLSLLL